MVCMLVDLTKQDRSDVIEILQNILTVHSDRDKFTRLA
jgi:hypothetical protein